jgi:hypothetical protein
MVQRDFIHMLLIKMISYLSCWCKNPREKKFMGSSLHAGIKIFTCSYKHAHENFYNLFLFSCANYFIYFYLHVLKNIFMFLFSCPHASENFYNLFLFSCANYLFILINTQKKIFINFYQHENYSHDDFYINAKLAESNLGFKLF